MSDDWIDVNQTKPQEFSRVIMKCSDGKERWGVYNPENAFYKWVFENECCEDLLPKKVTHWKSHD